MFLRKKNFITIFMIALAVVLTNLYVFASDDVNWTEADKTNDRWQQWCEQWETIKYDWTQLSLTPGKNESELNFAWYSLEKESSPKVRISKSSDMSNAKEFRGSQSRAVTGYKSNKVTITNLEKNSTYYYSYGTDRKWSDPIIYKTQSVDKFRFILVGDPQIGASLKNIASGEFEEQGQDKATRNDTFNWNNTLNKALQKSSNASFILSVGDQIQSRNKKVDREASLNYTGNEIEYSGFLSPTILKSLPIATSLGNHDAISGNYSYHFNNPNTSSLGSTAGGGDYYFRYGNSIFLMLNTNNTNVEEHEQFLEEVLNDNKDAKWRIVVVHQDIYGSGIHSNEPSIVNLRDELVPILECHKIDVVFTGHDHAYSRSKILKDGELKSNTYISDDKFKYYSEQEVNPNGILYMTSNSASGSKYYPNVSRKQSYIAYRWQENVPTFSTVSIDDESLSISTYRTDTMEKIDQTYTIIKSSDKSN
ncbi:Calcineurin-like phosphoesterase [uncultured Clostridium sp.]|nr:Calcineurin-like phosphoesterase [uncultured Clostridium sp.]